MSELHNIVAEKVEDGSYFEDGKAWYASRFIYPTSERLYFFAICVTMIATLGVSSFLLLTFFPLKRHIPYVVGLESDTDYHAILQPLGRKGDNPNQGLVNFLIAHYVTSWESYAFDSIDANRNAVEQFSSAKLLTKYKDRLSLRNAESPVVLFKQETIRAVEVIYISAQQPTLFVPPKSRGDTKAPKLGLKSTVQFRAIEKSQMGEKTSLWEAQIIFKYSPVRFDRKKQDFEPLYFEVVDYSVKPLS